MTRPGNGPYKPVRTGGEYQFSVRISPTLHKKLESQLLLGDKNRTDWIREAIVEKIARDALAGRK